MTRCFHKNLAFEHYEFENRKYQFLASIWHPDQLLQTLHDDSNVYPSIAQCNNGPKFWFHSEERTARITKHPTDKAKFSKLPVMTSHCQESNIQKRDKTIIVGFSAAGIVEDWTADFDCSIPTVNVVQGTH